MRRFAASALVAGLALTGVACGASMRKAAGRALARQQLVSLTVPSVHAGRGPFVPTGTLEGGSTSGHWGDGSSARTGTVLGCLSRRHYSFAITVRNRSRRVVTLTGARGPDPLPRILDRVAMQVRHAPLPPPAGEGLQRPLIQHWSAAPARPVRIRPGRSAVVQSNFLMRHCAYLPHNRRVTVPGSFVLSYRLSGRAGLQHVVQRNAGFSLVPGPIIRSCARVSGSVSLMSGNIGCALARQAATACRRMSHGTWGDCLAAGRRWGCHLHSSWVQECSFIYRTSRWYRVRWAE